MEAIPFIIAAAVSAGGAVYSARQQSAAQKTESRIAKQNASIAKQNAASALEEANAELQRRRRAFARFKATQMNQAVAAGLDLSSVTDILSDSSLEQKIEEASVAYKGRKEAYAYEQQSRTNLFQASLLSDAAKSTKTAGYISAAGALAGGYSSFQDRPVKSKTT